MKARGAGDVRVIEAARACLPFLEIRAEEERNADTLLRASDGRSASPDILLRPADGQVVTEPAHLLRAVRPEAESGYANRTADADELVENRKRDL